jgi:hypothetical protein
MAEGFSHVTIRKHDLTATAKQRFTNKCSRLAAPFFEAVHGFADVAGILSPDAGVATPVQSAVSVRHRYFADMIGGAASARTVKLVGADFYQRGGVAMIGTVDDNKVGAPGVGSSKSQRQFVSFASTANEIAYTKRVRHRRTDSPGVFDQIIMQIPGVGIQDGHLTTGRFHYLRVTVADVTHIVDTIQKCPSVFIIKILPATPNDFQRPAVGYT